MTESKFKLFVSTMFFSGLIPGAGGTYGSLVMWAIMLPIYHYNTPIMRIVWCAGLAFATFCWGSMCIPEAIEELLKRRPADKKAASGDFNAINIDEAHGIAISMLPIFIRQPEHWFIWTLIALGLFRLFDIKKPFGIRAFEKKFSAKYDNPAWKALIIILDDSIAALYTAISVSALMTASWYFLHIL